MNFLLALFLALPAVAQTDTLRVEPTWGIAGHYDTWTVTWEVGLAGLRPGGALRVQLPDTRHADRRNVFFRGAPGPLLAPQTVTLPELWAQLETGQAITILHHAGKVPRPPHHRRPRPRAAPQLRDLLRPRAERVLRPDAPAGLRAPSSSAPATRCFPLDPPGEPHDEPPEDGRRTTGHRVRQQPVVKPGEAPRCTESGEAPA